MGRLLQGLFREQNKQGKLLGWRQRGGNVQILFLPALKGKWILPVHFPLRPQCPNTGPWIVGNKGEPKGALRKGRAWKVRSFPFLILLSYCSCSQLLSYKGDNTLHCTAPKSWRIWRRKKEKPSCGSMWTFPLSHWRWSICLYLRGKAFDLKHCIFFHLSFVKAMLHFLMLHPPPPSINTLWSELKTCDPFLSETIWKRQVSQFCSGLICVQQMNVSNFLKQHIPLY